MSPRIVDREEKRNAILMAANTIFIKKGYHATTVQDIADAAGIGKGTVYEYFATKEDIVESLVNTILNEYDNRISSLHVEGIQTVAELEILLFELIVIPDHFKLALPFLLEALGHSIRIKGSLLEGMENWFDLYTKKLTPVFKKLQAEKKLNPYKDIHSLLRVLLSALDGFMLHTMMFSGEEKSYLKRKSAIIEIIKSVLHNNTNEAGEV